MDRMIVVQIKYEMKKKTTTLIYNRFIYFDSLRKTKVTEKYKSAKKVALNTYIGRWLTLLLVEIGNCYTNNMILPRV